MKLLKFLQSQQYLLQKKENIKIFSIQQRKGKSSRQSYYLPVEDV